MALNHSKFAAIEEERFLSGTRNLSALGKLGSSYLKKEFRPDCRKFLEGFVNCVVDCCRKFRNRPRVRLFLPSYSRWWRRSCPYATPGHIACWTARERMGEGRGDGGLQVGVPVVRARAEAPGADFT